MEGNAYVTEQKTLKRRIRSRMAKTGERYTTARHQLLSPPAKADAPRVAATKAKRVVPPPGMTSDAAMRSNTGRPWAEWIEILDAWGAEAKPHQAVPDRIGAKSIFVDAGSYAVVFTTHVEVHWGFDADGMLIDLVVYKDTDAL